MKRLFLISLLLAAMMQARAQSKTTLALQEKYNATFTLFFYKNTLRMLNQQDNQEFDALIQNIEKLKFLLVDKSKGNFGKTEYRKLVTEYQQEKFEPIVTSRIEGRNVDVYLRDAEGSKPGTVVLINDSSSLYILDIVGTIDVTKAGALFSVIDNNTDIGKRIRGFTEEKNDTVRRRKRRDKVD